ncbi:MAG: tRNA (guanine-N(7)-)-methyltransferase [Candidatus Nitricoxidivorans perseverans]|uniref:tRNA (guanine(46)-N(7))-methyltransferase n=1 Tax=Candidatus Nitricoxidivorans perseverans TaxID=2975601 RepID=A0AA49FJL4_9PROT|nr:MAG: tRNA (guanine-N(7)-)-methyltransferase [Candidatus Nitricoxidivorans perseverans]
MPPIRTALIAQILGGLAAVVFTIVFRPDIPPGWYLAAFVLLLLVFWRTDKSRVPIFLTNATTADAVATLLPRSPCRFIDLGCGDGGLLRRLARARPDCDFLGIEHAPLPWLWAKLAALGLPNCHIRHGNFWRRHLGQFDVVYAFLSPAPMPRLWVKAQGEMRPDALLISNSFPAPGAEPVRVVEVDDRRQSRLYCYRPPPLREVGKNKGSIASHFRPFPPASITNNPV